MGDLSKYFSKSEITCKCGCGFDSLDIQLLSYLNKIRETLGRPVIITSGCRCQAYNIKVGGKPDSAHIRGLAVDIRCNGYWVHSETDTELNIRVIPSQERYELLRVIVEFLSPITRMGIGKDFVHIDLDRSKPQYVYWVY